MESKQQMLFFDNYLDASIEQSKKKNFDLKLEKNNNLKIDFEEYKLLRLNLERAYFKEYLNLFHQLHSNKNILKFKNKWIIAASILLSLGMGFWSLFTIFESNNLYDKYFIKDSGLPTIMGNSSNIHFYETMIDYKLEDYPKAISTWEKLHKTNPNNDSINYYLGMCYLNTNSFQKAKEYLEKQSVLQSKTFKRKAHFYLGLIAINQGYTNTASKHFSQTNYEQSKRIYHELNK